MAFRIAESDPLTRCFTTSATEYAYVCRYKPSLFLLIPHIHVDVFDGKLLFG